MTKNNYFNINHTNIIIVGQNDKTGFNLKDVNSKLKQNNQFFDDNIKKECNQSSNDEEKNSSFQHSSNDEEKNNKFEHYFNDEEKSSSFKHYSNDEEKNISFEHSSNDEEKSGNFEYYSDDEEKNSSFEHDSNDEENFEQYSNDEEKNNYYKEYIIKLRNRNQMLVKLLKKSNHNFHNLYKKLEDIKNEKQNNTDEMEKIKQDFEKLSKENKKLNEEFNRINEENESLRKKNDNESFFIEYDRFRLLGSKGFSNAIFFKDLSYFNGNISKSTVEGMIVIELRDSSYLIRMFPIGNRCNYNGKGYYYLYSKNDYNNYNKIYLFNGPSVINYINYISYDFFINHSSGQVYVQNCFSKNYYKFKGINIF